MHDWNRATYYTVKALIPRLEEQGFVFPLPFPESDMMEMTAKN